MSTSCKLNSFLLTTGSLLSGIALGALLSPKSGPQNRKLLTQYASSIGHWLSQKYPIYKYRHCSKLLNIQQNMQKGFNRNIPDLYKATEQIELSAFELS